ncbi:MAG: hypothetical protein R3E79_16330 [Caldilineaceae bacterium]
MPPGSVRWPTPRWPSSTALVTTNPVFVALASWLFLREGPAGTWLGVLLTVVGSALSGWMTAAAACGSNPLS